MKLKPLGFFIVFVLALTFLACSSGKLRNQPTTSAAMNSASFWQAQGIDALYAGDYTSARKYLIEAYKQQPKNPRTLFYLGLTFELLDKDMLAFQIYSRFVNLPAGEYFRQLMRGRYHWMAARILENQYRTAATKPVNTYWEFVPGHVVVLPFYIQTDAEAWSGIGRALTQVITRDLEQISRLRVTADLEQRALFRALSLSENVPVNRAMVEKVQNAIGGGRVVVGSVSVRNGTMVQLRAAVIHPQSESLNFITRSGDITRFFHLQKELVLELIKQMDIRLTVQEREALHFYPTTSIEALRLFGLGLAAEDVGDYTTAEGYYQQAIAVDTGFFTAQHRLEYVRIMKLVSMPAPEVLHQLPAQKISAVVEMQPEG